MDVRFDRRAALGTLTGFALFGGLGTSSAAPGGQAVCVLNQSPPLRLSDLRGSVVYLDFWASWCAPCLLSFPFMNTLQKTYASRGLHIVAVNMDEKPADAQAFLSEHPASFAVAAGPNPDCARSFGVETMPTSFLIDRSGTVRLVHAGFRAGDAPALKGGIERLLAEQTHPAGAAQ